MNFNEKPQEYLFHSKEEAAKFAKALNGSRDINLSGKASVRKTKDAKTYSVHFKGMGLMDASSAAKLAKKMTGYNSKDAKTTPEFRAWFKLGPDAEFSDGSSMSRKAMGESGSVIEAMSDLLERLQ